MTPLTQEWVDKVEGDYVSALRELRARKLPNFDSSCFHSQQCAEKYLKARLQEAGLPVPFTHDLIRLLNLLLPIEPGLAFLQTHLQSLTIFAVGFRYPGNFAVRSDARAAAGDCAKVREALRLTLGLA